MKTTLQIILTFILSITTLQAAETLQIKPDFPIKNENGEILKRGIYTTGSNGEVLQYKLVDEATKITLHTEIPVYDSSGEIALTRIYDNENELKMIFVALESGSVKLDPDGNLMSEEQIKKVYSSEYKK